MAWAGGSSLFVAHYTPKHASWVNMELFFSIIARKVLKRGNYNETAKLFAWTYSGQPLKVAA